MNGVEAPPPIVGGWTYCDENADRAEAYARQYIGEYWRSVVRHYELIGDHLTKMRGYESYKPVQEMTSAPGRCSMRWSTSSSACRSGARPSNATSASSTSRTAPAPRRSTAIFSYGAMPYDLAEANLRLFAAEVMPALKRRVPIEDQLIARAGVGSSADAAAFRLPVMSRSGTRSASLRAQLDVDAGLALDVWLAPAARARS